MAHGYHTPAVPPVRVTQPIIVALSGEKPTMSFEGLMRLDKFTMLFHIRYGVTPSEDPYNFIDRFYKDYEQSRPAGSPPLTWDQFTQLVFKKFILFTLREEYRKHFECLQQGSMTVTQYETRFIDIAHHAVVFLPKERERVRRFIDGLAFGITLQMVKETRDDISFHRAVEISRWIIMIRGQGREAIFEKRPRHFGGFSGTSSRGRGSFGRVHPPRSIQSALQPSYDASGSCGSYGYRSE
ncbi:uncharacterized protein [Nicotiana tomentosiformis]|uniref:uncharacterized protein n=1 Tax=Nicotiana tomentosiformis TaxID=4098 RepID=UPI00388C672E